MVPDWYSEESEMTRPSRRIPRDVALTLYPEGHSPRWKLSRNIIFTVEDDQGNVAPALTLDNQSAISCAKDCP